jgi:hypothetical protein
LTTVKLGRSDLRNRLCENPASGIPMFEGNW